MSEGARPMRARRRSVPSTGNPQSTRMRVAPASTTRPLPALPLPSEAKRTPRPRLLQLIVEQRENPLGRAARVGRAVLVKHLHLARGCALLDHHAVLLGLRRLGGAPERELRQESAAGLRAAVVGRIDVAHEVEALRAVAVLDREADAVEREADPAPGAIERLVDVERRDTARRRHQLGALLARAAARGELGARALLLVPQLHHQLAEELRLELGIRRTRLPHRAVVLAAPPGELLDHAAVADEDLGALPVLGALEARAELVALAGRIDLVEQLAERVADRVLR